MKKSNLKSCKACGKEIAKGCRACPHCGKTYSNAAGLILALIVGLVVGWLMIARTCSQAAEADRQIEEMKLK